MVKRHGEAKAVHCCKELQTLVVLQIVLGCVTSSGTTQNGSVMANLPLENTGSMCTPHGLLYLSPESLPRKCFLDEFWAVYMFPKNVASTG